MTTALEIVRGLYAAFAVGDIPAFLAVLSPEIEWCEAEGFPLADGNPYVGPDAIVQGVFGRLGLLWDGFRVEPVEFHGSGDVVTMFGRYRATGRLSGRPLDVQVAHTFWVQDGKVVRFQQMCDTAAVVASLAVEPKPARAAGKAKGAKQVKKAKQAKKPAAKRATKAPAKAKGKAKGKPNARRTSR